MPRLRYLGSGGYRLRDGPTFQQGEAIEVDEATASRLTERWDFERVDGADADADPGEGDEQEVAGDPEARDGVPDDVSGPLPFDPSAHTVADVRERVEDVDDPETVRALRNLEQQHDDRATAVEALERRLDELEG